jgi:hypothetical protein
MARSPDTVRSASKPVPSSAGGNPLRPEKPDPLASPRAPGVKIDRDPLAKGSVRPNPSGDLDE